MLSLTLIALLAAPPSTECQAAFTALSQGSAALYTDTASLHLYEGSLTEPTTRARLLASSALTPAQLAEGQPPPTRLVVMGVTDRRFTLDAPLEGAVFPADMVAPILRWRGEAPHWLVRLRVGGYALVISTAAAPAPLQLDERVHAEGVAARHPEDARAWRPSPAVWGLVRACGEAQITLQGLDERGVLQAESAPRRIIISPDPVGAPIFFRDVPIPFKYALKHLKTIRWRLGSIATREAPRTVLENMPVCANCHSFSRDGGVLGMDVDYANDKGAYVAVETTAAEVEMSPKDVITWSDFRKEDSEPTFGLLSQVSPDGRYVISTVKDVSVHVFVPDLSYSQLFFPIRGILAVYDRQEQRFFALPGADNPNFVQSNPTWSPDGEYIVFARAEAVPLKGKRSSSAVVTREHLSEVLSYDRFSLKNKKSAQYRYDLYKIPFNQGKGGVADPLLGASGNGKSNYFPKFSPDGRHIVFCQANSYMLLQADSALYIIPSQGGEARRLDANAEGQMNSWHSFSPNGRWLAFSSKRTGPHTRVWLTHIDEAGRDSPPVMIEGFTQANRAINIPEFVPLDDSTRLMRLKDATTDAYGYYRAGLQYFELSDFALAAATLREALSRKPDDADSHLLLGRALTAMGDPGALAHLQEAARLSPNDAATRRLLVEALLKVERLDEASAQLSWLLNLDGDDAASLSALAEIQLKRGDVAGVETLTRLRRLTPSVAVDLRLSEAHARFGFLPNAVADLERALTVKPKHITAALRLARILATDAALRDAPRAVRLVDQACADGACVSVAQRLTQAAAYAAAGRYAEALALARQAEARAVGAEAAEARAYLQAFEAGQPFTQARP
ncbi:tetratricopeptide repeat protein [Myxococcota bacterium]|nr:tetratricopeptide repeat protein [Myxococcota bacterium]